MTSTLRTARTCTAAAALCLGTAVYGATISFWLTLPGLYVGAIAWWCRSHSYADHRRTVARHGQEQRAATGPAQLPVPCCQFWTNSDGAVHGPDCTRPLLARRDRYRLTAADQAVFQQIAARIDLPGPNDRSSAA